MQTYEINLLEELNISSVVIGFLFAILGLKSGIASKNQERVHKRFKNKSLQAIATGAVVSVFITGITALFIKNIYVAMIIISIQYALKYICSGLYYNLIEKYLRNFANEKIDTKIFVVNQLLKSIICALMGIGASILLDKLNIMYCILAVSIVYSLFVILICKYMKPRVGLSPNEYGKNERKYDELKV